MANRIRSNRPFVRSTSQRRQTVWIGLPFSTNTLTAGGGTIIASLSAGGLALRPFTIVRTLYQIYIRSDQVAAREIYAGAFAEAVVSEEAVTAGVAAMPTPVTEADSDLFFVYQTFIGGVMAGDASDKQRRDQNQPRSQELALQLHLQ